MENFSFDTNTKELIDSIRQLMEIPDEKLNEPQVEMILGAFKGAFTPQVKEEAIIELVQQMKETGNFKLDEQLEAMEEVVVELLSEYENVSPLKEKLVRGIFSLFTDLMVEAAERLGKYDTRVYFELTHPNAKIPTYAHDTDAGADVYAPEDITIQPNARGQMVDVGFKMAMMPGWFMDVRPRSGLSYKTTMRISNAPGTIDADYRNNVGILIDNFSNEPIVIHAGDRIAQFVLHPVYRFFGEQVDSVDKIGANRNGGFGSTGN